MDILSESESPIESANIVDPEPTGETMLVSARVKLNTRFAWRRNKAGAPIMQVYPKDNSLVSMRVQIAKGKPILVYKQSFTADGGGKYWCIVGSQVKHKTTLYVRQQDVKKAG